MKLKKLTLTNFRNYEDFTIDFNKNMNVIVAENGAGKTTILDAIAIGYGAMLTRFPKIKGKTFEKSDLRIDFDNKAVPYMRVELESYIKVLKKSKSMTSPSLFAEDEVNISWDRTKARNKTKTTKKFITKAKGLKELHDYVDSIVDKEYEEDVPDYEIPLIMYYGTSRAVFKDSIRKGHFKQEFSRYGALSSSLKSDTNFTRYFQWFSTMENEENRQIKEQICRLNLTFLILTP
jgi:predicted ATP-binding protein involved in virulence